MCNKSTWNSPKIGFLGNVLPNESIYVFDGSLFPRRIWVCKVDSLIEFPCNDLMCSELNRGLRLAPDNGMEMRLVDADDAVGTSASCSPSLSCPREGGRPAWPNGWICSIPKVTPEVQTGRDCDIVSSISSRFLNVLTSKGSLLGQIDQILYNINN